MGAMCNELPDWFYSVCGQDTSRDVEMNTTMNCADGINLKDGIDMKDVGTLSSLAHELKCSFTARLYILMQFFLNSFIGPAQSFINYKVHGKCLHGFYHLLNCRGSSQSYGWPRRCCPSCACSCQQASNVDSSFCQMLMRLSMLCTSRRGIIFRLRCPSWI